MKGVILKKKCKSKRYYTLLHLSSLRVLWYTASTWNYKPQSCSHSESEAQLSVQSKKVEKQQHRICILPREKIQPRCNLLEPVLGVSMTFRWSTQTSAVIRLNFWPLTEMLLFNFIVLSKIFSIMKTLVRSSLRFQF